MIKLPDGELLDLLPAAMKADIDMVCLSYAIKEVTKELLQTLEYTRTQSFIDGLPEKILDVLAIETNAMYYDEELPIESKRSIIRASMSAWFARAGTPAAVEELVQAVFGEGEVIEWFDFTEGDATPGLFDIVTNATLTEDLLESFVRMIRRVKNERSHLRRVLVDRTVRASPKAGAVAVSSPNINIKPASTMRINSQAGERCVVAASTFPHIHVTEVV